MSGSEQKSFEEGRFEEVLGSLSRRIVDPVDMIRTVVELLQPLTQPDLSNHRTILRLSRNLNNQPVIVTTNFDTMLEKALLDVDGAKQVRALSFAGQDLPSPGSADFAGIIHLHGRVADECIELEETPLVVTSADYGDAYMRSGWASRFLFDLCRCKTIVLVGYSASDAPVRYFLNVLEADRQRFPDLRPVYALDAVDAREEADLRWGALAVEPIVYERVTDTATGRKNHSALWRDLDHLADVVERPRTTRRRWTEATLAKSVAAVDPAELDRILWLLSGHHDLWPVAITTISDATWFDFFVDRKLWSDQDAAWIVGCWLARDFESVYRFQLAITWLERLGQPFADVIASRVSHTKDLPDLWVRAWRLLTISQPRCDFNLGRQSYASQNRLRGPVVLHADLHMAVGLLTPVLRVKANHYELDSECEFSSPKQLCDLIRPSWVVYDIDGAPGLVDALSAVSQPGVIMALATARLQEVFGTSLDIDGGGEDAYINDFSVPSIEPHAQNEHHDGVIFLVQLLAQLLPAIAKTNRREGRLLSETWRHMPRILGVRLWLHALRNTMLFSADEAISGLDKLPINVFWSIRRELALVLRDRAADADPALVALIELRILNEGVTYYESYALEKGQVDWRSHARDAEVWLRLNMLRTAGVLSDGGINELAAIKVRRDYLDREVEDSDFFMSYSTGVRISMGDSLPITEAADDERLEVARATIHSPNIEKRQGWSAYCRTDPSGAFDTLKGSSLDASNAPLWSALIGSLSFRKDELDSTTRGLVINIFSMLEPATESFLGLIIGRLSELYSSSPRQAAPKIAAWWPRLFASAIAHENLPLGDSRKIYENAINSSGGRLTEAALIDIERSRQANEPISKNLLDAIKQAAGAEGRQGAFARAILVNAAGFVLTIEGQKVGEILDTALGDTSADGVALRAILVNQSRLSLVASQAFAKHILRGVIEVDNRGRVASTAAAKIVAPALSIIRQEKNAHVWGISLSDTASALQSGSPALREGVASILLQWIDQIEGGPAMAWRSSIGPLLAQVWPRERALREKGLTRHFSRLALKSAEAFPEALKQLLPYLTLLEGNGDLYAIEQSSSPEQFPRETLTLLWRLFGPGTTSSLYGMPNILERMIESDPLIELDRRLQWLYQQAGRHE
ncbi:SIR2 family protein [Pseudomonas sp. Irchel s3f19]|uniref:SIR2 family protein n=1 Tax=Pseudomonas sp. Irchel s3f19 TaxID=2009146 RepID=UPI0021155D3D|nr:SIR2 family protein [Pseudomonas sp. Irchel s3f19]